MLLMIYIPSFEDFLNLCICEWTTLIPASQNTGKKNQTVRVHLFLSLLNWETRIPVLSSNCEQFEKLEK